MEALGVITHVDQPTDWVSLITYIQKANGEFCLCLDASITPDTMFHAQVLCLVLYLK